MRRLPRLSAVDLTRCAWALAHVGPRPVGPSYQMMAEIWRAALRLLPTMSTRSLMALISASEVLHFAPGYHELEVGQAMYHNGPAAGT